MRNYEELLQTANKVMLEKLRENKHKKGFTGHRIQYLMRRINDEYNELKQAYAHYMFAKENQGDNSYELQDIIYEAADVMNFCAILILNAKERINGGKL